MKPGGEVLIEGAGAFCGREKEIIPSSLAFAGSGHEFGHIPALFSRVGKYGNYRVRHGIHKDVKMGDYHIEIRCRGAKARFAKGSLIVT